LKRFGFVVAGATNKMKDDDSVSADDSSQSSYEEEAEEEEESPPSSAKIKPARNRHQSAGRKPVQFIREISGENYLVPQIC
jgi:hypothetical protein